MESGTSTNELIAAPNKGIVGYWLEAYVSYDRQDTYNINSWI